MKDLGRAPLRLAIQALETGDPVTAIAIASEVIERRPNHAKAYLIRSQAHYAADNAMLGMADLLGGLSFDSKAAIADTLETQLFDRLAAALNNGWGELNLAAQAAGDFPDLPPVSQVLALLAGMIANDADAVADSLARIGIDGLPLFSARLAARLHLNAGSVDKAIAAFEQSEALASREASVRGELASILAFAKEFGTSEQKRNSAPANHRLAICSVIKNEGDNLAEWIVYHAELGVDAFYLYDNDSADDTARILDKLSRKFQIIRHKISEQPSQLLGYRHFLTHHRFEAEWAAFMDGDEFLQPEAGNSLKSIVERRGACGAIAANWMVFGSAGHPVKPQGLCIEAFDRRAEAGDWVNAQFKSIVRPASIVRYTGPHQHLVFGHYEDPGGGIVFPLATRLWPPRHHGLRVNHYAVKSREQAERKIARGRPTAGTGPGRFRDGSYIAKFDINTEEDRSAAAIAPAVRKALSDLGLPV
jgi:tetratricopeptide (TPR) repeat protein